MRDFALAERATAVTDAKHGLQIKPVRFHGEASRSIPRPVLTKLIELARGYTQRIYAGTLGLAAPLAGRWLDVWPGTRIIAFSH